MTPFSSILSRRVVLLGAFGTALLAACGETDHYSPPTTPGDRSAVQVGERGPDFTLPDATGQPVSLASYRGKPVILVFFRTFG